jgi:predicted ATP-grasp superfamily ATP-dependent carboligase
VYLANFENEPDAVTALAAGRALWGNPADFLRRVRDPALLATAVREHGLPYARIRPNAPNAPNDPNDWVMKPLASGGGRGIHRWTGDAIPPGCYLQEWIDGVPGSVAFVAANGAAVPIGFSVQLVGDRAFGADGYRYCGNILAPAADVVFEHGEVLLDRACAVAAAVTASFGLVGVNGVDFIASAGEAYPLEVNPRWSGSMELVERAYGVSVFGAHAAACARAELPVFDLRTARAGAPAVGKAVVFARSGVTMGDTGAWLGDPTVRDVPHPGERIAAGRPICTVFAEARDANGCYAALVDRANRIYATVVA